MTFAELKQEVYDLLGLTGEATMMARFVNQAKDELCSAKPWWWRETSADFAVTSGTRAYTATTDAETVLGVLTSAGIPMDFVDRITYEELYRESASTAASPTAYTMEGAQTTGAPKFHVWPNPSANSTCTLQYLRKIPDMSLDTETPQHIPPSHHYVLVKLAAVRFRRWEENFAAADALEAEAKADIEGLTGASRSGQVLDTT